MRKNGIEVEVVDEGQKCWKGYEKKGTKKMFGKTYNNCVKKEEVENVDEACWKTHEQRGMKKKGGKMVPNCVPKGSVKEGYGVGDVDQKVGAVTSIPKDEQEAAKKRLLAKAAKKRELAQKIKEDRERLEAMDEATYPSDFINPDGSKRSVAKPKRDNRNMRPKQHDQETDSYGRRKTVDEGVLDAALKTDKKMGELHKKVENDVKRMKAGKKFKEEVEQSESYDPKGQRKLIKKMQSLAKPDPDSTVKQNQKRRDRSDKMSDIHHTSYTRPKSIPGGIGGPEWQSRQNKASRTQKEEVEQNGSVYMVTFSWRGKMMAMKIFFPETRKPSRQEVEDAMCKIYPGCKVRHFDDSHVNQGDGYLNVGKSDVYAEFDEGAAWTKKSGKNEKGGLNEKGRKSYEKENPGSDLKRPSKKVGNPRRASFCARMSGMKKKLTSKKTANDPDSRINKSLRAWNC